MRRAISDPDVQLLASIAATLKTDYVKPGAADPWEGSPFAWIIHLRSSRRRGKIGEQLVAGWCAAKGLAVGPARGSQADRMIAGRRVEIKFSALWDSGIYNFQQIRDQEYDLVFCLGISPFDAHAWVIPKMVARTNTAGQHGGSSAKETHWLMFPAEGPPAWLRPFGGTLADVFQKLKDVK